MNHEQEPQEQIYNTNKSGNNAENESQALEQDALLQGVKVVNESVARTFTDTVKLSDLEITNSKSRKGSRSPAVHPYPKWKSVMESQTPFVRGIILGILRKIYLYPYHQSHLQNPIQSKEDITVGFVRETSTDELQYARGIGDKSVTLVKELFKKPD